ncbi:OsmC family protein [Eudoraea chungangensis]|uniref:OsmC family protein n=1 Tax=Eudoraea chungangensis TaxID=1481905 RepID=UPI0023EAA0E2|nr:OsmC family protein [Eudoraea chungangensis]
MTSKVIYLGDLRTQCVHFSSGKVFITDAPTDNNGKGEAFSPTDTVATALASCMLTVMGIKAADMAVELLNSSAEVTKFMVASPRRISKIEVVLKLPKRVSDKEKAILENTAKTCPVLQSLHPDIIKEIVFQWDF